MGKLNAVDDVLKDVKTVVNYLDNHTLPHHILKEWAHKLGMKRWLEKESKTRFATHCRMLGSVLNLKAAIIACVGDVRFPTETGARNVKWLAVDPGSSFWDDVLYLHKLWTPFADALYRVEAEWITLGDAYWILRDLDKVCTTTQHLCITVDQKAA